VKEKRARAYEYPDGLPPPASSDAIVIARFVVTFP
jgi:hypothetical protein